MPGKKWDPESGDSLTIIGDLNPQGNLETNDGVYELPDHSELQKEIDMIREYWEESPTVAISYEAENPEATSDYVVLRARPSVSPRELSEVLNNFSERIK